jgi:hypothetical protein
MEKDIYLKNLSKLVIAIKKVYDITYSDKYLRSSRRETILYDVSYLIDDIQNENIHGLSFEIKDYDPVFSYQKNSNKWDDSNRIEIKLGRFFQKYYGFNDWSIDYICKNIIAILTPEEKLNKLINIISGDDIVTHYKETKIRTCMTGINNINKLVLYAKNKDRISLLTVKGYSCRALIWKTDEGVSVLDRIYPAGHSLTPTIRIWAKNNGYVLRSSPDSYITYAQTIKLENNETYKITLNDTQIYPFLDTFVFGLKNNGKLILSNNFNHGNMALQNQYGEYIEFARCNCCKLNIQDGSIHRFNDENYCYNCYRKLFMSCNHCGVIHKKEDLIYKTMIGSLVCEKCSKQFYYKCEDCGFYERKSSFIKINNRQLCKNCYNKKYVKCYMCNRNDLKKKSKLITNINGMIFCKKCSKKLKKCSTCGGLIVKNSKTINNKPVCNYCFRYRSKNYTDAVNTNAVYVDYATNPDYKEIIDYIKNNNISTYYI